MMGPQGQVPFPGPLGLPAGAASGLRHREQLCSGRPYPLTGLGRQCVWESPAASENAGLDSA